jgi:nucleotide-binding universal stress UspA family protein
MEARLHRPVIVVGIDGSDEAERALRWTIEEAKLREANLRIVTAWHVPFVVHAAHGSAPPATLSIDDVVREAAEGVAQDAARKVVDAAPSLAVETTVVEGHAGDVLIESAKGAALLVVGSRPQSSLSSMLTGSVTVQCAVHAPVPTAIIR